MPSLRRTFSAPSARSSPYPTYSPSSALYGSASRTQGAYGHRRSSGSETSARRVLADIDWWRVADGQRAGLASHDVRHGQENRNRDRHHRGVREQPAGGGAATISLSLELDGSPEPWTLLSPLVSSLSEERSLPPTHQLAALSITPRRPSTPEDDSAPPSLLATPESAVLPLEGLGFDFNTPSRVPSSVRGRNRVATMPVFPTKTKLFDDHLFFNDMGDYQPVGLYADFTISPLSSHSPVLLN
ncbi:hypothetical protein AX17_003919 [Amanita inopinata Kibby_2008]|nr:hypothetical protein AX17_003919 [Amanita inopinata Kibby_2008]